MRHVLLFVGAFGVLLVHCRCFLVTLLHLVVAFQHKLRIILMKFFVMCVSAINCENIIVSRYIILFMCGVIKVTRLGIFSRSYYALIMGFLARSEIVIYSYYVLYIKKLNSMV
jgi:hypothetical protein